MRLLLLLAAATFAAPLHAQSPWAAHAIQHRGGDVRATYDCPAGGTAYTIWGTALYTDDSSVCTAAVHRGLISLQGGGTVTILMSGGANEYAASTQNGITSRSYGRWVGSFRFVGDGSGIAPPPSSQSATSGTSVTNKRGQNGSRFTFICPAGGSAGAVWGSGVYTDDSSVCTAGVHAGALSFASGGTVTIEILDGRDAYEASERNGVSTYKYGRWRGSFRVVQ